MQIEGYASTTSLMPGETIDFHVSASLPCAAHLSIYKVGAKDVCLHEQAVKLDLQPIRQRASAIGCDWPSSYCFIVPEDWTSALYRAEFSHTEISDKELVKIFFVVKSVLPGTTSSIIFQSAVTTSQAYNPWPTTYPGESIYESDSPTRNRKVSFNRPHHLLQPEFNYNREVQFIRWLERNGLPVEHCTSIDLHADANLLDHYQLLLSVGHDEYWSLEMRNQVERFIQNGGNVAFFSGNTCWWQVRFEDNNRTMVCYKSMVEDPLVGEDNSRVTINWTDAPVCRPENFLTGVGFLNGAGTWLKGAQQTKGMDYKVRFADHWVFAGTDLKNGDSFGGNEKILGHETDACDFIEVGGVPQVTGKDGTPANFVILATADLRDWRSSGRGGYATMGLYRRNGTVFNAATIDWWRALNHSGSPENQITRNIITRLKNRYPLTEWEVIGHAPHLNSLAEIQKKIYAVTINGGLYFRNPGGQNFSWEFLQEAKNIVALTGAWPNELVNDFHLLAATNDNSLVYLELFNSSKTTQGWQNIAHSYNALSLAVANNRIFMADSKQQFLSFDILNNKEGKWKQIGESPKIMAMTFIYGSLLSATRDGRLLCWDLREETPRWQVVGTTPEKIVAMTSYAGKLYAATSDGLLFWRDAIRAEL